MHYGYLWALLFCCCCTETARNFFHNLNAICKYYVDIECLNVRMKCNDNSLWKNWKSLNHHNEYFFSISIIFLCLHCLLIVSTQIYWSKAKFECSEGRKEKLIKLCTRICAVYVIYRRKRATVTAALVKLIKFDRKYFQALFFCVWVLCCDQFGLNYWIRNYTEHAKTYVQQYEV